MTVTFGRRNTGELEPGATQEDQRDEVVSAVEAVCTPSEPQYLAVEALYAAVGESRADIAGYGCARGQRQPIHDADASHSCSFASRR